MLLLLPRYALRQPLLGPFVGPGKFDDNLDDSLC